MGNTPRRSLEQLYFACDCIIMNYFWGCVLKIEGLKNQFVVLNLVLIIIICTSLGKSFVGAKHGDKNSIVL